MSHVADIAAVAASVDAETDFSFKIDLEEDEGQGLGGQGLGGQGLGGECTLGNRLANTLEASDEVMLSVASGDEMDEEEDDDGAHLFKPTKDDGVTQGPDGLRQSVDALAPGGEEYEADFEAESPRAGGGGHGVGVDGQFQGGLSSPPRPVGGKASAGESLDIHILPLTSLILTPLLTNTNI